MSAENLKSKIIENGKTWHRVGDVGYLDHDQNLWFLGRKTHRVVVNESTTHYPIRVEAIFNQHPEIRRTALIQILKNGTVAPALVIERFDGQKNMQSKFLDDLKLLASSSQYTQMIEDFYLHPAFPVDVRHNIKIDRTKLSAWAQKQKYHSI
jgi:acyl-CoA synthetase (AMP-forming)/AMP-acid ligase II